TRRQVPLVGAKGPSLRKGGHRDNPEQLSCGSVIELQAAGIPDFPRRPEKAAGEGILPRPVAQDTETPNASPATRVDSLPSVPLTVAAPAWKPAPPLRNMGFLSPHHWLTSSVRDWELASKLASPL